MTTQLNKPMAVARSAFTLLEMILATAIAVLLLAALYVAVDLQLRHAATARDMIEQTTLARTLLTRIANDIAPGIATADPTRYQQSGQSGSGGSGGSSQKGGGGSTGSGGGGNTGATGGAMASNGAAANSNANSGNSQGTIGTTTTTTVNSFSPPANSSGSTSVTSSPNGLAVLALQGTSNTLTLYVTRVPADPTSSQNANNNQTQLPGISDMRRVYYWLAEGEGLCRQEVNPVTSDDAQNGNVPAGSPDPSSRELLAKEVRSLQFEYYDGSNWTGEWDGTQAGSDGITPIGPPVLVRITIELALPDGSGTKKYQHVVAIPTTNGVNANQQSNSTDSTGTSGSGGGASSGTGSGSGSGSGSSGP